LIVACCDCHTKHGNTLCGQNAVCLGVTAGETYIKHCFIKLTHILILLSHPLVEYQTVFLSSAAQDKFCMLLSLPYVLHVPAI